MNYNKYKKKGIIAAAIMLTIINTFYGCGALRQEKTEENVSEMNNKPVSMNVEDMFTDRDKETDYDRSSAVAIKLSDDGSQCDSDFVDISDNTITINNEGTYILSGELSNGQIVVEAEQTDKLQLVFDNVSVNCDTSAAVYVKQADKVFITLAEGSENELSNTSEFSAIDENNIDSVIFSKDDITLNGSGSLVINAECGHGIVSKDDLVLTGGTYSITAAGHALSGKDSVRIADGSYTLITGKDGIHAENGDDVSLGFIYIAGGSFTIESEGDGMDSGSSLYIEEGEISIDAGGGSVNAETHQETWGRMPFSDSETSDTETLSTKGIKAAGNLIINGGAIDIDSADDAIHSNADISISNAECELSAGDDGIHADSNVTVNSGSIIVKKSCEGIEGQTIDIIGGNINLTASDDGINAAGGNDGSGFGGMPENMSASGDSSYIKISGGFLYVNADGDGLDSNGNLYVSGGEIYVDGPSGSANGALDYSGEAQITGGIFVAVGDSGMAMNFGEGSSQGTMLVNLSSGHSADQIVLKDSSGAELITYEPAKSYNSVVISCPEIKQNESYTLIAGEEAVAVEMSSLVYGSGNGFGGNRDGGFGRGRDNNFPMKMESIPDNADGDKGNRPDWGGDGNMTPYDMGNGSMEPPEMRDGNMEPPEMRDGNMEPPEMNSEN